MRGHVRAATALLVSVLAGCGASDGVPKAVLVPGIDAYDLEVTPEHTLLAVQRDGTTFEIDSQGGKKPRAVLPVLVPGRSRDERLAEHLQPPVIDVAARDDGVVFYLHGDPARISRADGTQVADVPGARAIVFGNGGGLDPAHLYIAEPDAISLIRPD